MQVRHEVHLTLAFLIWGIVGVALFAAGIIFLTKGGSSSGALQMGLLVIGLVLGFIKSRFVLNKVARKNINRIYTLPRESSPLATFSLKSWILVLVMILLGRSIRFLGAPPAAVGFIYIAVGFGLALSSRTYLSGRSVAQKT